MTIFVAYLHRVAIQQAPIAAVLVVSPPRCNVDWHGLISLRMICKARSCANLVCMIVVGHVPIAHVSGSLQLGHILHEMVIISMLGEHYVGAAP